MNPAVKEAEQRLLSAALHDAEATLSMSDAFTSSMFSSRKHKEVYDAILEIADSGETVDYVSVSNKLSWIKPSELVAMTDRFIPSTTYVKSDIKIIIEDYRKRRIKETTAVIMNDAQSSEEMIARMQDEIDSLNNTGTITSESLGCQTRAWADALVDALDNGGATGIPTGYSQYDSLTGGLKNNHLVVIGARPKVGKSTFGLNIAYRVAKAGIPCAFFSLEMGNDEIITKLAGIDANIRGLNHLDGKKVSEAVKAVERIDKLPLHILDSTGFDYRIILNKCRNLIRKHNVQVIFIDYLQLMHGGDKSSRNNEIGEITRAIKQFNMQHRIPIVLLSQLNRMVEHQDNRRPRFSDLRDSGSIEQDANVIVFLHRQNDDSDTLEVIIAGNRGGGTGYFTCRFDKPASRIDAIDYGRE